MIVEIKKTGDDEKDIDADKAALDRAGKGVKGDNREHDDRPQPVNIRTIGGMSKFERLSDQCMAIRCYDFHQKRSPQCYNRGGRSRRSS